MEASHHHHHHLFPLCAHHHHHHPHGGVVHPHPVHHHHPHHHHHHPLCILKPHYLPTQNPLLPNLPQFNTNLEVLEEPELLQEYVEIEEEDDEEEPVFVMTDEWMEFFAKSEAKRQLEKKQAKMLKKKEKKMNKGTD
ncbi:hypothetical protein ACHQM5_013319 [Ranunculus cassubicifolius]